MTLLGEIRDQNVELWLVDDGENIAVRSKQAEHIRFVKEHKDKLIDELKLELDQLGELHDGNHHSEPIEEDENWFVAMTTAPRQDCRLLQSIKEVREAGWEPLIFAEPHSTKSNAETIWNSHVRGAYHNWSQAAWTAWETGAPHILLLQDDITVHPDTKLVMDGLMTQLADGAISLYTSRKYGYKRAPGVRRLKPRSLWGACAMAFSRDTLGKLLQTKTMTKWNGASIRSKSKRKEIAQRRKENPHLVANVDTAIGKGLREINRPTYFLIPSPVSHSAVFSTLQHGPNVGSRNAFPVAVKNLPLEPQLKRPCFVAARAAQAAAKTYPVIGTPMVTSLSPRRIQHQRKCLELWRQLGVERIIAVQLESEMETIGEQFGDDVEIRISRNRHDDFPLPLLRDMTSISRELDEPILLCNADIEPYCTQEYFLRNWIDVPEHTLQWGNRWDYKHDLRSVTNKCAGIDVFRITPEMPLDSGERLAIGMVSWDYWIPFVLCKQNDYRSRTDSEPVFFHQEHSRRAWNRNIYLAQADLTAKMLNTSRKEMENFAHYFKQQAEAEAKDRDSETEYERPKIRLRNKKAEKVERSYLEGLRTQKVEDVTILTCLYNETDQTRENYDRWIKFLGPMAEHVICLGEGERYDLWQQEALINVGLSKATTKYVAWLDPDVLFADPKWLAHAVERLNDGLGALQLFGHLWLLDQNGVVEDKRISAAKSFIEYRHRGGHTGCAWIANREKLKAIGGLTTVSPIGGDDSFWISLLTGDTQFAKYFNGAMARWHEQWYGQAKHVFSRDNMHYVDCRAYHLWHMTPEQRQYSDRFGILNQYGYDPAVDITTGEDGLLRWASEKPGLHRRVAQFFEKRDPHLYERNHGSNF